MCDDGKQQRRLLTSHFQRKNSLSMKASMRNIGFIFVVGRLDLCACAPEKLTAAHFMKRNFGPFSTRAIELDGSLLLLLLLFWEKMNTKHNRCVFAVFISTLWDQTHSSSKVQFLLLSFVHGILSVCVCFNNVFRLLIFVYALSLSFLHSVFSQHTCTHWNEKSVEESSKMEENRTEPSTSNGIQRPTKRPFHFDVCGYAIHIFTHHWSRSNSWKS